MDRGTYRMQCVRASTRSRLALYRVLDGPDQGEYVGGRLDDETVIKLAGAVLDLSGARKYLLHELVEACVGQSAMCDVEDDEVKLVHSVFQIGPQIVRLQHSGEWVLDEYAEYVQLDELGGRLIPPARVYMKSARWAEARDWVPERAQWVCEAARCKRAATQIHHLSYKWFGFEFPDHLDDLKALCAKHHMREHGR